jgi:hypothetical protein
MDRNRRRALVMALGVLTFLLSGLFPAAESSATPVPSVLGSICAVPHCPYRGPIRRVSFSLPRSVQSSTRGAFASLRIKVTGLPKGTGAEVQITSPGGAVTTVSRSTRIAKAAPGQWSVVANPISVGPVSYFAAVGTTVVSLAAASHGDVKVEYV